MHRTGLIVALAIAAAAGLLFGLFPGLDLAVARAFYGFTDGSNNMFALRLSPLVMLLRNAGLWVGIILVAPAVAALAIKLVWPRRKLLMSGRAILFLTATMALGPGLLVNVVLKDHWGRSRPIDVTQFGGPEKFVPWWDPRGECPANCSFVSGDVAGAFWTIAPAALTPPPYRAAAYGAALALGTAMAAFRVMAGGHFPSDVIFAGVFTFLVVWLCYALIYRWPRTRLEDDDVEHALERIGLPVHDFVAGIFRKKKTEL
ncbi:MAG: phosphatase PAP2 family protein [Devosia nanyangense]|uniref:Phosphatase PAP2 family protein n=1 Tax=Devosia nanyangense TaxID=1228055 RepID=A0A933L5D9_9HYPH|nr:phosphatase PAP2 family protein [Devosia nanyangense]